MFVLKLSGIKKKKSYSDLVWQIQLISIKGSKFPTHTVVNSNRLFCSQKTSVKALIPLFQTSFFASKKPDLWLSEYEEKMICYERKKTND
jgi:hypothetical protein